MIGDTGLVAFSFKIATSIEEVLSEELDLYLINSGGSFMRENTQGGGIKNARREINVINNSDLSTTFVLKILYPDVCNVYPLQSSKYFLPVCLDKSH